MEIVLHKNIEISLEMGQDKDGDCA